MEENIVILIALGAFYFAIVTIFAKQIVLPFQQGLHYRNGKFIRVLGPGKYHINKSASKITLVDVRRNSLVLPAQEILTKDKINIKVSAYVIYHVVDAEKYIHGSANATGELYGTVQIALREVVSSLALDELLEKQADVNLQLLSKLKGATNVIGIEVDDLSLRDVILPASLKRAFAAVEENKKQALANLEKARGEQALLRSLANSAALFDQNPSLLQSRLIQALSEGKHTIVFGGDATNIQPATTQQKT